MIENQPNKKNKNLKAGYIRPGVKEVLHKINKFITTKEIRIVTEELQGIYSLQEALKLAEDLNLDLVEISSNVQPAICRIVEYGKFLYELKKKEQEMKKKSKNVVVKDIRFGPNTDEHDYNFKLKNSIQFLKDGFKVKVFVFFKGREIVFKQKGEILLLKFADALSEWGKAEQLPFLEGKKMQIMISPKKK